MDNNPSIRHEVKRGNLYVTVEGLTSISDTVAYAHEHFDAWAKSPGVLWDIQRMVVSFIPGEFADMSDAFAKISRARTGHHTAVVVRTEDLELGRLIVEYTKLRNVPVEHKAFVSIDKAQAWLQAVRA